MLSWSAYCIAGSLYCTDWSLYCTVQSSSARIYSESRILSSPENEGIYHIFRLVKAHKNNLRNLSAILVPPHPTFDEKVSKRGSRMSRSSPIADIGHIRILCFFCTPSINISSIHWSSKERGNRKLFYVRVRNPSPPGF